MMTPDVARQVPKTLAISGIGVIPQLAAGAKGRWHPLCYAGVA
jgi:hypothetical protein